MDDVVCEEDEDDDEMKKRSDKVEWYTNVNHRAHHQGESMKQENE